MTALACALAFGFALAFAGWVLWLRERRGETVESELEAVNDTIMAISAKVMTLATELQGLPALKSTVSDLAMKAGLSKRG